MLNWMIYGANGYTGRKIARECINRGHRPILAGRNQKQIIALAESLSLPFRIFSVNDNEAAIEELSKVHTLLNCAGPFHQTCLPLLKACMKSKTNYLDISGEIESFETIFAHREEIETHKIVAIPGVGFDVVPTDCLASMLKQRVPDATHLTLAFCPQGGASPGTTKTMIEGLAHGSKVRIDGKIKTVDKQRVQPLHLGNRRGYGVSIPWGDVSTAFHSTAIPNIKVFLVSDARSAKKTNAMFRMRPFFRQRLFKNGLQKLVGRFASGPDSETLKNSKAFIWGKVTGPSGKSLALGLKTPNGYQLTIDSSLLAIERLLESPLLPGAYTPSLAFGNQFVFDLPGVERL